MSLTDKHIRLLRLSANGVDYYKDLNADERSAMNFLLEQRLCEFRSLDQTVCFATELGKTVLAGISIKEAQAASEQREKERVESKRIEERREDYANEERRYRTQNKIAIIMPLVTFFLGVLTEHFFDVFGTLANQIHALF